MNFGANVRDCRLMRNMTQVELAEKVGIARSGLTLIEIGTKVLSVPLAVELANALNVPVIWLIEGIKE